MRSHKKIDRRNERRERKEIMLNTLLGTSVVQSCQDLYSNCDKQLASKAII